MRIDLRTSQVLLTAVGLIVALTDASMQAEGADTVGYARIADSQPVRPAPPAIAPRAEPAAPSCGQPQNSCGATCGTCTICPPSDCSTCGPCGCGVNIVTFGDVKSWLFGKAKCRTHCSCRNDQSGKNCPNGGCHRTGGSRLHDWWLGQQAMYLARNRQQSEHLMAWSRAKFGYFHPSGCCGDGCPPLGHYNIVYAADPNYFDARDGRVFAAPGTGVPMAVPLAPNVHYTYNYSSGVPSSRLTPISRVLPPQ